MRLRSRTENTCHTLYTAAFCGLLVLSLCFQGCKKDEEEFSDTPELTFISISPATAKEYTDKIYIEISYKDGNGDLGTANPDTSNLFVVDKRISLTYKYRLRDLSTPKGNPPIQGKVKIEIPPTAIFAGGGSAQSESVSYDVYLVDDAGHQSNVVTTSAITVTK